MLDKLANIERRYAEIEKQLSDPTVMQKQNLYRELTREEAELSKIVDATRKFKKLIADIHSAQQVLADESDPDMRELAEAELEELDEKKLLLEEKLKVLLIPKDPQDARNAIIEIRAGTGGDEAGLFAGDLYRMYQYYAEKNNWKIDVISSNPQGIGGFREIIFNITGDEVYGSMKFEAGVHRVQRVPTTEASGRIHTSAASVAVLPEAEEIDVDIDPNDLRIDVYRSSGPGGQSVNTTDSAVRITHLPTGLVVTCQDEKSQHKNRAKALKVLRARLYDKALEAEQAKLTAERRSMVSTGDRSAKIRTYNYPQGRVTDHRIGLTAYRLEEIMQGDLDDFTEKLKLADRAEKLKHME
ncbi:peptide chain release factor 1 [candidate division KSB1 bacterium]|nr:peptide chain release factor 1 [candidate division KSB1 bacterium]RQW05133.1 MAG: peptide chain release factor 1 [candidate division KSB1 bacterium]